jgi:hypothetical protein
VGETHRKTQNWEREVSWWKWGLNYEYEGCTYGTSEGYIPHQEEPNPKLSSSHSSGITIAVKTPTRVVLDVTGSMAKGQKLDAS